MEQPLCGDTVVPSALPGAQRKQLQWSNSFLRAHTAALLGAHTAESTPICTPGRRRSVKEGVVCGAVRRREQDDHAHYDQKDLCVFFTGLDRSPTARFWKRTLPIWPTMPSIYTTRAAASTRVLEYYSSSKLLVRVLIWPKVTSISLQLFLVSLQTWSKFNVAVD